jgi:hypothetical protein
MIRIAWNVILKNRNQQAIERALVFATLRDLLRGAEGAPAPDWPAFEGRRTGVSTAFASSNNRETFCPEQGGFCAEQG